MTNINLSKKFDLSAVLSNGVKVYNFDVKNDFKTAQKILNLNENTRVFDSWGCYEDRQNEDMFEGVYKVHVKPYDSHERFIEMLEQEKCKVTRYNEVEEANQRWWRDEIEHREYEQIRDSILNCQCDKCTFNPTIEQWMTGFYEETIFISNEHFTGEKVRKERMTKKMQKLGYSQTLLDFYSAQIKLEKDVFLFVTGKVQFVAGMSNFARSHSWDGYGGTSCQDTRLGGAYCRHLGGALHDDTLFVAGLVENIEDLENMQDKLQARVLMRLVTINNMYHLIPTRLYGNQQTKALLNGALKELSALCIHDMAVRDTIEKGDNVQWHNESANGALQYTRTKRIEININRGHYTMCDCPICYGTGEMEYTYYNEDIEEDIEETCECLECGGDGQVEEYIERWVETYKDVEEEVEILPYYELETYEHEGDYIEISVNYSEIERRMIKNGMKTV